MRLRQWLLLVVLFLALALGLGLGLGLRGDRTEKATGDKIVGGTDYRYPKGYRTGHYGLKTRSAAHRRMMKKVKYAANRWFDLAEELGLRHCATVGSLLGYTRAGGIIPWDDDWDEALVDERSKRRMRELYEASPVAERTPISPHDWEMRQLRPGVEIMWSPRVKFYKVVFDGKDDVWIDVFVAHPDRETYDRLVPQLQLTARAHDVLLEGVARCGLRQVEFDGVRTYVPADDDVSRAYCDEMYGEGRWSNMRPPST
jgi:hypothetical protein